MKNSVTVPRTISVAGYTATINIKFVTYDEGKRYYCSVSETAKAIKAIAKEAGLTVLKCKSQSYSGGDHVDLILQSKLTPEQREEDRNYYKGINSFWHTNEPEQDLADKICWAFQGGKFNGYEDIYEYRQDNMQVEAPNGEMVSLDTKYCFNAFRTPEEV